MRTTSNRLKLFHIPNKPKLSQILTLNKSCGTGTCHKRGDFFRRGNNRIAPLTERQCCQRDASLQPAREVAVQPAVNDADCERVARADAVNNLYRQGGLVDGLRAVPTYCALRCE